jgi:integrase
MELTVSALFSKYLAWCQLHRSPRTCEWYANHLGSFLAHLGEAAELPPDGLKPYHVVEWVDAQTAWGDTYRRGAISAVQRALNWAEDLGYITATPIKKVPKPQAKRRDNPMSAEDYQSILAFLNAKDPFRDLLVFVWHTGCRPQEARHIEARHVQLDRERIVLPKEEAKGKRYPRVIYLHGESLEVVRRLLPLRPEGKLFRNARGGAWNKYSICNRMDRYSKRLGKRLALYDARHGFATRKLTQGHDHLTVAELLGHRDGTMVAKVYGHLDREVGHLKRALAD